MHGQMKECKWIGIPPLQSLLIPLCSDRPVGRWYNGQCVAVDKDNIYRPIKDEVILQGKYSTMDLCLERCNFDWPCAYNNRGFRFRKKCYQVRGCSYNKKTHECSTITAQVDTGHSPTHTDTHMCFVFLNNRKDKLGHPNLPVI